MLPELSIIVFDFVHGTPKYYREKMKASLDILEKWFVDFKQNYSELALRGDIETRHFLLFVFNNYIFPDGCYIHGKDYSPIRYRR